MKSLAIVGLCALATEASAQSWQPPLPNERCPSKWGAADERGSANHMKPANVLRAAQLIKTGETFELAQVHSARISATATRSWLLQRSVRSARSSTASPIRQSIGCSTTA